jgi:hypothetical protein
MPIQHVHKHQLPHLLVECAPVVGQFWQFSGAVCILTLLPLPLRPLLDRPLVQREAPDHVAVEAAVQAADQVCENVA